MNDIEIKRKIFLLKAIYDEYINSRIENSDISAHSGLCETAEELVDLEVMTLLEGDILSSDFIDYALSLNGEVYIDDIGHMPLRLQYLEKTIKSLEELNNELDNIHKKLTT